VQLFNAIYFWLDFPLIVVVGLWLYFWHRHQYTVVRDAILSSGAIALVIYHLFPVAPPRLVPGLGLVDTLAEFSSLAYQTQSTAPFVNPYAAVPSLHVGWAVLLMLGIIWATRSKPVWLLAFILPWAQFAAIVFTANHFIFDAMVGVVVSLVAGFGAIISEVGAVMMVGGNIEGHTRVLTTAIVQLTRMGAFAAAMALGLILLALAFLVNLGMLRLQGRME